MCMRVPVNDEIAIIHDPSWRAYPSLPSYTGSAPSLVVLPTYHASVIRNPHPWKGRTCEIAEMRRR